jgi:vancomycin resistance protein YoaR
MSDTKKTKIPKQSPDRAARRAERRKRERERRQRVTVLALLGLVAALVALCGWRYAGYADFQRMRAAVEVETFYAGTHVEGIDVSGLTLSEAQARWKAEIEPAYAGRAVTLSDGTAVTAAMVGYQSDYFDALEAAYAAGRSGGLGERYGVLSQAGSGVDYAVTRTFYTQSGLEAFASALADAIDAEPVEPVVERLDASSYEFVFTEGVTGKELNQQALVRDIAAAFDAGASDVALDIDETPVAAPTSEYGVIAYVSTDAGSSSSARLHNIRTAIKSIDGLKLDPGEQFSFNEIVGKRTKANGYRKAKAYYGMSDIMEYGGGICQLSSTLYASVLGAQLRVDERHEHTRRVWYMKKGYDAAIDWGRKDLRFTNNRDEPIYIGCVVDKNENVRVAIFGRIEPGDPGLDAPAPGKK